MQLCYGFQVESFWPRNQEMGVDLKPAREKILGQGDWKMLVSQCTLQEILLTKVTIPWPASVP